MEALVLDHFLVILQQIHAEFQIVPARDISDHHPVVGTIEQNLPEQLGALALRDVRLGHDERPIETVEEEVEVRLNECGCNIFVVKQNVLEAKVTIAPTSSTQLALTLKVANTSALTAKPPVSIQSKKSQNTPCPC